VQSALIRAAALLVLGRGVHIPNHNTAELGVALDALYKCFGLIKGEVAAVGRGGASGKTDVQKSILAGLIVEIVRPVVEVEATVLAVTGRVVVELNEQGIELHGINDLLHLEILGVERAFGGSSDEEVAVLTLNEPAQLVDHVRVKVLVVLEVLFDVKIKTIDHNGRCVGDNIERARHSAARLLRTKCLPDEVGEIQGVGLSRYIVVGSRLRRATNGQEHLLALRLAVRDIGSDDVAVTQELGRLPVLGVNISCAVGAEV